MPFVVVLGACSLVFEPSDQSAIDAGRQSSDAAILDSGPPRTDASETVASDASVPLPCDPGFTFDPLPIRADTNTKGVYSNAMAFVDVALRITTEGSGLVTAPNEINHYKENGVHNWVFEFQADTPGIYEVGFFENILSELENRVASCTIRIEAPQP